MQINTKNPKPPSVFGKNNQDCRSRWPAQKAGTPYRNSVPDYIEKGLLPIFNTRARNHLPDKRPTCREETTLGETSHFDPKSHTICPQRLIYIKKEVPLLHFSHYFLHSICKIALPLHQKTEDSGSSHKRARRPLDILKDGAATTGTQESRTLHTKKEFGNERDK